jgi:hypothetical protein
MPQIIDLTSQLFGRLTVTDFAGRRNRRTYWICRCECGHIGEYEGGNLQQGFTTKCKNCRYKFCKKREGKKLRHQGKTRTIEEWADEIGVSARTIYCRAHRGNPISRVLFPGTLEQPIQGRIITFRGETKTVRQWAASLGISVQALKMRLKNWTKTRALTAPNTWSNNGTTKTSTRN